MGKCGDSSSDPMTSLVIYAMEGRVAAGRVIGCKTIREHEHQAVLGEVQSHPTTPRFAQHRCKGIKTAKVDADSCSG